MPRTQTWWVITGSDTAPTAWTLGDDQSGNVVSRHVVANDWLITVWSALDPSGARRIREVDVAPTSSARRDPLADLKATARTRWRRWVEEGPVAAGLSSKFFREIPLGKLLEEQMRSIAANDEALEHLSAEQKSKVESVPPSMAHLESADDRMAALLRDAEAYSRLVAAGDRQPAKSWAKQTGENWRTVQDRIRRARAAGLLTPATPGGAGGQLTPQAKKLREQLLASRRRGTE